jgi:hypothetical protein
MTRSKSGDVHVGIEDPTTGQGDVLRVGDTTADGWLLVAADFDAEAAIFDRGGHRHTCRVTQRESPALPVPSVASHAPARTRHHPLRPSPPDDPPSKPAFSNRVLSTSAGHAIALAGVIGDPYIAELRAGSATYAIRRDVVETILGADGLSADDRARMLCTFPGLISVEDGQSATEQVQTHERRLAEALTPPTNAPSAGQLRAWLEAFTNAIVQPRR